MNTPSQLPHPPPLHPDGQVTEVPRDRPENPNPVVDGTRFQGVEYPAQHDREPSGESATGREEAAAARVDQEKIGTPAASL